MNKSAISRHITLLAAVLSAAFASTTLAVTSSDYVQNGLIAHWDGIENVGRGQHSDATAVWTDLVGGRSFELFSATVRDDSIVFSGASSSYGTLDADGTAATFNIVGQKGMIEMVFKYVSGMVFLQSPASSGVAMGFLSSTSILPFSGTGSSAAGISFPSSLRGLTNTVSVGYTSTKPVTTTYYLNGAPASTASGSYWGSPGSVTYIGRRASGAASSVALYAIRLYNRHLTAAEIAANRHVDETRFILKQESEAPALPYCVATANENLSATFAFQLACGGGSDTADISLALGRAGDAMATNLLAASLASGYHECTVEGLRANTAYQAVLLARNENGFTTNGPAMAFETGSYPADETGPGRAIAIAATNRADGAVASLDLAFAPGEEGVANQLYALLGLSPGGLVTGAWKRVVHLGAIAPETTSYHYDLPAGWGSDYRALRFAFDLEKELPYDGMVEYLESTGAQWIDTGVRGAIEAGGGLEATADLTFLTTGDVGFLASRSSGSRCYLIYPYAGWTIGYGGSFTGGGSLSLGTRYLVESVLHDGWQSITANGVVQKKATYSGAVDSGCNLYVFRLNYNNSPSAAPKARLYSLTLSRMGTLLRDYIPCTTNGAGALYDRVTHTVFPNKSSTPFTLGRAVPLQCYAPFSPTFYHVDEEIPSIASVALSQLTGSSFTITGSLESFGGTREGCRVRLHIGTEGADGAFSQFGEAVVPEADGTVAYDVTGLTGGTTYWYYLEVTSSAGAQAASPPASVKTPSYATVSAALRSVVKSTLTVGGAYQVQGASAADVVLLVGHDAASATAKASTNLLSVGDEYTFVWEGYKDACDWSKLHYWQVRAITATGDAAWTNVCGSGTFQLQDSNAYEWTGGGEADAAGFRDWTDTDNWTTTDTGAEKAGAPVNVYSTASFAQGGAVRVKLAQSIGLRGLFVDAEGLDLVVQGEGSPAIDMTLYLSSDDNMHAGRPVFLSVSGTNTSARLSGLTLSMANSAQVKNGATLTLDAVTMGMQGLLCLSPRRADAVGTAYGGGRCELVNGSALTIRSDDVNYWGGLYLAGGGEMVVRDSRLTSGAIFDFKRGGGLLRLEGGTPVVQAAYLRALGASNIPDAGTGAVVFSVPASGYASAPLRVTGVVGGAATLSNVGALAVGVAADSPALAAGARLETPLVSAPAGVNRGRTLLSGTARASRCGYLLGTTSAAPWNWTPAADWTDEAMPLSIGARLAPPGNTVLIIQ